MLRIVLTGPESTGKSFLAEKLSYLYSGYYIPEYARTYLTENKITKYVFQDLVNISNYQINEFDMYSNKTKIAFFDTFLIITKVWFEWTYKYCPIYLHNQIRIKKPDLYLLCNTEQEWIPDNLRENGGENRELLFKEYELNLKNYNLPYQIISGTGDERLKNTVRIIDELISVCL